MNKLKQVINYGQKSYIPEGKKKSQVAHSCTYMFVYLKIKRKDKCSLCKLGLFFFCLVQEVGLMDGGI